jgi:hypothetical protein
MRPIALAWIVLSSLACTGPDDETDTSADTDTETDTDSDTDTDTDTGCAPEDERLFWRDADNDTYGVGEESIRACEAPDGYAAQAGDCNDGDPTIHPDAPDDQCNGVDNDCVDGPDSDLPIVTRYADGDGDGWGVDTETSAGCLPSEGWAEQAGDCDDARDAVHPDAPEVCDGLDNDCADGPDDGLWGSGAACPADSCTDLKARLPSTTSGTFWLRDDAGSYQAQCRVDGAGAWTRLTGKLLRERGWVTFDLSGGSSAAATDWVGEWQGDDLRFIPRRRSTASGCNTVVIEANADLPFEFTAWEGSFSATGVFNDTDAPRWGTAFTSGSPPCRGAVLFGNPQSLIKRGSEWGRWTSGTAGSTWSPRTLDFPASTFTWELNDYNDNATHRADLTVSDIDLWVR